MKSMHIYTESDRSDRQVSGWWSLLIYTSAFHAGPDKAKPTRAGVEPINSWASNLILS